MEAYHRLNELAQELGIRFYLTDGECDEGQVGWHYRGGDSDGIEKAIKAAANYGYDTIWVHYRDTPEQCLGSAVEDEQCFAERDIN